MWTSRERSHNLSTISVIGVISTSKFIIYVISTWKFIFHCQSPTLWKPSHNNIIACWGDLTYPAKAEPLIINCLVLRTRGDMSKISLSHVNSHWWFKKGQNLYTINMIIIKFYSFVFTVLLYWNTGNGLVSHARLSYNIPKEGETVKLYWWNGQYLAVVAQYVLTE